jgi:multisubunit Na+/H+ antiporter MnhB subunit
LIVLIIIVAAIILTVIDFRELKGKDRTRDTIVYTGCMLVAIGISIWYTLIMYKTSIADILLRLLNLKG